MLISTPTLPPPPPLLLLLRPLLLLPLLLLLLQVLLLILLLLLLPLPLLLRLPLPLLLLPLPLPPLLLLLLQYRYCYRVSSYYCCCCCCCCCLCHNSSNSNTHDDTVKSSSNTRTPEGPTDRALHVEAGVGSTSADAKAAQIAKVAATWVGSNLRKLGVSENRGPEYSTLNSRILIALIFGNSQILAWGFNEGSSGCIFGGWVPGGW